MYIFYFFSFFVEKNWFFSVVKKNLSNFVKFCEILSILWNFDVFYFFEIFVFFRLCRLARFFCTTFWVFWIFSFFVYYSHRKWFSEIHFWKKMNFFFKKVQKWTVWAQKVEFGVLGTPSIQSGVQKRGSKSGSRRWSESESGGVRFWVRGPNF